MHKNCECKNPLPLLIPKSRGEVVVAFIITAFLMFFVVVAISNIILRIELIASVIWLVLVLGVITSVLNDK